MYFKQVLGRINHARRNPSSFEELLKVLAATGDIIMQKGGRFLRKIDEAREYGPIYEILDRPRLLQNFRAGLERNFSNRSNASTKIIELPAEGEDHDPTKMATIAGTLATTRPHNPQFNDSQAVLQPVHHEDILCHCAERDVLFGNKTYSSWPGNRYFSLLIHNVCATAPKVQSQIDEHWKNCLVSSIVNDVTAKGGKFLRSSSNISVGLHPTNEKIWVELNQPTILLTVRKILDDYMSREATTQTDREQCAAPLAFAQLPSQSKSAQSREATTQRDREQLMAAACAFQSSFKGTIYGNKQKVISAGPVPPSDHIAGVDWTGWQKEKEGRFGGGHQDAYW